MESQLWELLLFLGHAVFSLKNESETTGPSEQQETLLLPKPCYTARLLQGLQPGCMEGAPSPAIQPLPSRDNAEQHSNSLLEIRRKGTAHFH